MSTRRMVLAAVFAATIAVSAFVVIPIPGSPVPFTMQVLVVLLASAVLGSKTGFASVLAYLAIGALGVPVFSGGRAGIAVLAGPTGGYLWGFLLASAVVGRIASGAGSVADFGAGAGSDAACSANSDRWRMLLAMSAGIAVIYVFGWVQLAIVANIGFARAFAVGVLPFIPLDLAKAAAAGSIALRVRRVTESARASMSL